ncbi:MAG: hypothetical protein ACW99R_10595 [Candidatus Hodarchaeales archaeon]|jgi:hypothetical protein
MIVYALYIIDEGGRPLVSQYFQPSDDVPNEVLFGALFTAFKDLAADVTTQKSWEMKSIGIDRLFYHTKSFGPFNVVIVTNTQEGPENLLQTIGLRFMKEHRQELVKDFLVDLRIFDPFMETIQEIVQGQNLIDESGKLRPTKRFSVGGIFDLSSDLQATALALITIEEGTLEEISEESGENQVQTEKSLDSLQKMGYIGRKAKDGKQVFFYSA